MPHSLEPREKDNRAVPRTSLYLAAVLYSDRRPSSVRIRNISSAGALVDAAETSVGTMVQLARGRLAVEGLVIWATKNRCGIRFWGNIDVKQWRAAPDNCEQQRVDNVVGLVKAGVVPMLPRERPAAGELCLPANEQIADDLRRAAALLDGLEDLLANNPEFAAQHAASLQDFDIATQLIAVVQAIIAGDNGAATSARLSGLRVSAEQALRRR